ncbi:MAG: phosphate-starvation-inducible PsiE family protein [Haloarculaceae archaeon]
MGDGTGEPRVSGHRRTEEAFEAIGDRSELLMDVLELATAFIMIILFAIGVYDLGLKLYQMVASGSHTDPDNVIHLIDTALLLLIVVEIYRTVIAYVEDKNILPIVMNVGVVAMARKIISFRTTKYATKNDALLSALSYGLLMLVLIVSFYLLHRIQKETEFNIYAAGEGTDDTSA